MTIPLSPMDYYFFRKNLYTIQFVFEYQGHIDEKTFAVNLVRTTQVLEVLGSRIKIVSETEIVLEGGHPVPVSYRRLGQEPPSIDRIGADQFLDSIENIAGEPLVKIALTHTPTRTFLGFSFSHLLGDGASFFQFISTLVKISKEEESNFSSCNQRELLQVDQSMVTNQKSLFDSTGYIMPRPPNLPICTTEVIRYSFSNLKKLKAQSHDEKEPLSNNDIIMADLAKRFHRSIPLHEGKFIIRCPVDYRKIYGLPTNYFGNAVRDALAIFGPAEIEKMELFKIAKRIKRAIKAVDKENVAESLVCLDSLRKKDGISIFEQLGCPGLLVSNLSKFPFQSIDLGAGSPMGFHQASFNSRVALILPLSDGLEVRFKRPIERSPFSSSP